jgi:hypothetical protein
MMFATLQNHSQVGRCHAISAADIEKGEEERWVEVVLESDRLLLLLDPKRVLLCREIIGRSKGESSSEKVEETLRGDKGLVGLKEGLSERVVLRDPPVKKKPQPCQCSVQLRSFTDKTRGYELRTAIILNVRRQLRDEGFERPALDLLLALLTIDHKEVFGRVVGSFEEPRKFELAAGEGEGERAEKLLSF